MLYHGYLLSLHLSKHAGRIPVLVMFPEYRSWLPLGSYTLDKGRDQRWTGARMRRSAFLNWPDYWEGLHWYMAVRVGHYLPFRQCIL